MGDEFVKEVLGEEAARSAVPGKKNGKKIAIIAAVIVAVVAIVLCVIFFWPKEKKKGTFLSGIDVLCAPCGLALGKDGTYFVTDTYGKKIWTIKENHATVYAGADTVKDQYGEPTGGYNDADLSDSLFKEPWGIAPFLNGYAVADAENHAVRLVTDTLVQTVNGRSGDLEEGDLGVTFERPTGLASDETGNLYVADTGRGAIYRITPEGKVDTFKDGLNAPMGICWYGGVLYVAETGEHRVITVKDGIVSVVAGNGDEGDDDGPAMTATFSSPMGVAVGADGTVYVGDTVNGTVRRVKNGMVDTVLSADDKELTTSPVSPTGLFYQDGTVYVCDPFARKIYYIAE